MKSLKVLILFILLLSLGSCYKPGMTIQSQTMTLVMPENSNEIHIHYLFEGISVADDSKETYDRAISQLSYLNKTANSIFVLIPDIDQGNIKLGDLRFFKDRTRLRSLCAERRSIILDKSKLLNQINDSLRMYNEGNLKPYLDEESILKEFRKRPKEIPTISLSTDSLEMVLMSALASIYPFYDEESLIKTVRFLKKDNQEFVNFNKGTISLRIPTSKVFSDKITALEFKNNWLKNSRRHLPDIDVVTYEEGIEIVLGKPGKAIQITRTGSNGFSRKYERSFRIHAGNNGLVLKSSKNIQGSHLINGFLQASKSGDSTKILALEADLMEDKELFGEILEPSVNEPAKVKTSGHLRSQINVKIKTVNGKVVYNLLGQDYSLTELKKFIPTLAKVMDSQAKISLEVDDNATFKSVKEIQKVLSEAGFNQLSINSK